MESRAGGTTDDGSDHPDPSGFTTAAEWGRGLTALRERSGLSVRDLARAAGASASTVGGYVAGRHLPTPAATDTVRRLLAACGVDEAAQEPWLDALVRLRRAAVRGADAPAPYKGLDGYDVADAPWFCGREDLTAALVERALAGADLPLLLVGASGSGKSSILRAGLAAGLQQRDWRLVVLTPGTDPDAALRAATAAAHDAAASGRPVLVVVDQLEELWTTGAPEPAWRSAVRRLADLAATDGVAVAAALRADFYARALTSGPLTQALQRSQVVVGPMRRDELVRAVTGPAALADVALEPGLVDVLLADLAPRGARPDGEAYEPGALPLLSFALLATWQRHRTRLTVADYTRSGGIAGAVAAAAEAVHAGLDARERGLARRLFTRLVAVGEETGDTRRRVGHAELDALDPHEPGPGVADVVERFVAARLLTAGEHHVEITHEALLVAWPRLRGWLDDDRAGLVVQRSLADSAAAWLRSGRDADQLLRGTRLEAAREWAARPDNAAALTGDERAFVEESLTAAARRQHLERRRTRRLQVLTAGLAVGLAGVAGLTAYSQDLRVDAERARDLAQSRQLAEAANRLRAVDPVVAARFALLAYRTSPTVEARSALLDATALPLARRLDGPGGIASVAVSGDGRLMAAVGAEGGLRVWRVAGGDPAVVAPARAGTVDAAADPVDDDLFAVAVDGSGRRLATGGFGGAVRVWDVSDPSAPVQVARLGTQGLTVLALAISPSGVLAAALTGTDPQEPGSGRQVGRLALWSLDDAAVTALGEPLDLGSTLHAVAFDRSGEVLAVGAGDGTVHRVRVGPDGPAGTAGPVLTGPTEQVTSVAFHPSGTALAAGSKDLLTHVWSIGTPDGAPVPPDPADPARTDRRLEGAQSWVNTVAYSADGTTLAAGSSDSRLRLYDTATSGLLTEVGNPGPVTAAVYTPDGSALLSSGADGAVRVTPHPLPLAGIAGGRTFALTHLDPQVVVGANATALRMVDVSRPFVAEPLSDNVSAPVTETAESFAGTLAVERDRRLLASGGGSGSTWVYRVDGPAGPALAAAVPRPQTRLVESAAFVAGGRALVTGADDSTLSVTDVGDPQRPVALGDPVEPGGIVYAMTSSPDGSVLATGTGTSGLVQLWDATDPARLRLLAEAPAAGRPTLQVYGLAFTRDGLLAVGSADRTVRFLDVRDPAAPAWVGVPVEGAGDYVFGVQFSGDGGRLAAASGDGLVRVYDVVGRGVVRPYAVLGAAGAVRLYSVALRPDGGQVSSAGASEAILTWTLDAEAAARRVCALAGDPVQPDEWARYLPSVQPEDPCAQGAGT